MLAKPLGSTIPTEPDRKAPGGWAFEPKWDGFRAILFAGETPADLTVQSRSGEDLTYCFPEVVEAIGPQLPAGTVLDGELVVLRDGRPDFPTLTSRIRPRSETGGRSITGLATSAPARFIAFDLLGTSGGSIMDEPYDVRRSALEALAAGWIPPLHLSPMTHSPDVATAWFDAFVGAGVDGVMAKDRASAYQPGRRVAFKVKPEHTLDAVVAGWRPHRTPAPDGGEMVGSLVLGLYDADGTLHHVGVTSAFPAQRRVELLADVAPYSLDDDPAGSATGSPEHPWSGAPAAGQRLPGGHSRWAKGEKALTLLRPELVAEVRFDAFQDGRLRHTAQFVRWRPDKAARECTYDQVPTSSAATLLDVLDA